MTNSTEEKSLLDSGSIYEEILETFRNKTSFEYASNSNSEIDNLWDRLYKHTCEIKQEPGSAQHFIDEGRLCITKWMQNPNLNICDILASCLILSAHRNSWNDIYNNPLDIPNRDVIKKNIAKQFKSQDYLKNLTIKDDYHDPHYIKRIENAIDRGKIETVYRFINDSADAFEVAFRDHYIKLVELLYWGFKECWRETTNRTQDPVLLYFLSMALSTEEHWEEISKIQNNWAITVFISKYVKTRRYQDPVVEVEKIGQGFWSIENQIADFWKQLMHCINGISGFNKCLYPGIGWCLARCEKSKIDDFVNTIHYLPGETSFDSISMMWEEFQKQPNEEQASWLFEIAIERWESSLDTAWGKIESLVNLTATSLGNIVISGLLYFHTAEQLKTRLFEYLEEIKTAKQDRWFTNESQHKYFLIAVYSKILILSYAWKNSRGSFERDEHKLLSETILDSRLLSIFYSESRHHLQNLISNLGLTQPNPLL